MRVLYCHERKVWFKRCSCCNIDTLGTDDYKESLEIIQTMFSPSLGSAQSYDGLQSRCWICNASKRRELGISRAQIELMMAKQDSSCAICCSDISISRDAPAFKKANVDHDQASGVVRALLCGSCNRGIGLFYHNAHTLRLAADYCDHYSKVIKLQRKTDAA